MKPKKILSLAGIALCAFLTISARNTPPPVAEYKLSLSWPPAIVSESDEKPQDTQNTASAPDFGKITWVEENAPDPAPLRPVHILPEAVSLPAWLKNAVPVPLRGMRHELAQNTSSAALPDPALIAIVIDDMGLGSS